MIKEIRYLFIITIFVTTIFSCESVVLPKPEPIVLDTTPISYSKEIIPIWTMYCVNCHGDKGTPPNLTEKDSYLSLSARADFETDTSLAAESNIYKRMIDGTMPPSGKLDDSLTNKVLNWIRQGALNN